MMTATAASSQYRQRVVRRPHLPFCRLDLAADDSADLSAKVDHLGIDRLEHPLAGGSNQPDHLRERRFVLFRHSEIRRRIASPVPSSTLLSPPNDFSGPREHCKEPRARVRRPCSTGMKCVMNGVEAQ
jgi:hypothetical protein